MSTARMTFGTVLGTVTDAAQAVSTTLGVITKSAGMLDTYVSDAAKKQQLRSLIENESYKTRIVEESAMEDTERHLRLKEFMSQTADHEDLYKKNYERIAALVEKK